MIPKWMQSSVDPSKVSLSVESFGKALVGLVAVFAAFKGLDPATAQSQFQLIVDAAAAGAASIFTAWNSLQMLWGLVRKFFVKVSPIGGAVVPVSATPVDVVPPQAGNETAG